MTALANTAMFTDPQKFFMQDSNWGILQKKVLFLPLELSSGWEPETDIDRTVVGSSIKSSWIV